MKGKICRSHKVNFPGENELLAVNKFYATGYKSVKTGEKLYYNDCKKCMQRYRMLLKNRLDQDVAHVLKRDLKKIRRIRCRKKIQKKVDTGLVL